jgi:hypothetical protein
VSSHCNPRLLVSTKVPASFPPSLLPASLPTYLTPNSYLLTCFTPHSSLLTLLLSASPTVQEGSVVRRVVLYLFHSISMSFWLVTPLGSKV